MITPKDKPEPPFKHEGGNARPHRTEDGKPPGPPPPVQPPPGPPPPVQPPPVPPPPGTP
jgi:hypothetical protein